MADNLIICVLVIVSPSLFLRSWLCGVVGDLECLLVMAAAVAMETGE